MNQRVLCFSRGKGRRHAISDAAVAADVIARKPSVDVTFASYGTGGPFHCSSLPAGALPPAVRLDPFCSQIHDGLKQLVKERRYAAAFKALQNRRQTDLSTRIVRRALGRHRQASPCRNALRRGGAIFGALLMIVGVIVVGLTAGGLRVSEWTLFSGR
jgi:diphthamide synthase subunit DPH2